MRVLRKWAYLKEPYLYNQKDMVYKIMVYKTKNTGVFVFLYCSKDAMQCSFDCYYDELSDALEDWQDQIDENGWHEIDDPLPYCQHDTFLPIRVKGRNIGKPIWGQLEILKDGKWIEYHPI